MLYSMQLKKGDVFTFDVLVKEHDMLKDDVLLDSTLKMKCAGAEETENRTLKGEGCFLNVAIVFKKMENCLGKDLLKRPNRGGIGAMRADRETPAERMQERRENRQENREDRQENREDKKEERQAKREGKKEDRQEARCVLCPR